MATSIELVLLKCIQCGTPVPANEDEAAWTCAQCGQGMQLTEAGLAPLAVNWAAARPGATQLRWLPFWVFTGAVTFLRRETYGGSLFGGGQPDKLWDSPRQFYVPAYPAALQEIETLGADLTRRQPRLAPGPAAGALSQCTLFPDDARRAAEFVVLTIEADRKDKLRQVDFTLSLQDPMLWVLPFAGEKPALAE